MFLKQPPICFFSVHYPADPATRERRYYECNSALLVLHAAVTSCGRVGPKVPQQHLTASAGLPSRKHASHLIWSKFSSLWFIPPGNLLLLRGPARMLTYLLWALQATPCTVNYNSACVLTSPIRSSMNSSAVFATVASLLDGTTRAVLCCPQDLLLVHQMSFPPASAAADWGHPQFLGWSNPVAITIWHLSHFLRSLPLLFFPLCQLQNQDIHLYVSIPPGSMEITRFPNAAAEWGRDIRYGMGPVLQPAAFQQTFTTSDTDQAGPLAPNMMAKQGAAKSRRLRDAHYRNI